MVTAGAPGDSTHLLRAMLAEGAQGPVAAILADSGERHFAVNERFRSVP